MVRINDSKRRIQRALIVAMLPAMADYTWAVGLGQIKVYSGLGQPLRAEIPIQLDRNQPLVPEQFVARIADMEMHRQRGITSPTGSEGVRIEVVSDQDGDLSIKLTSRQPINEPIVNFLIRLQWPDGEFVKEVAALLDPPNLARTKALARTTPEKPEVTSTAPAKSPRQRYADSPSDYGPVRPLDTLMQVARNVREDSPIPLRTVMQRIFDRNPKAFSNHDINRLQAGAWLTIPDLYAPAPLPKAKKKIPPKISPNLWASETRYGPITAGESLWEIAQRIHGDKPAEINAWMEAVAERNPKAFIGRNTDRLMAGAVLIVPGSAPPPKEETQAVEAAPTPVVAPPPMEQKAEQPAQAAEAATTLPEPEKTDVSAGADQPVIRVTGLETEQDNAVRIKDLEEQLAQERSLAEDREEQNRQLAERLAALERETKELRQKTLSLASVPAPSPVAETPSAKGTETENSSSGIWWTGGLFAMSLGAALFWVMRNRSTRAVPAENIRNWFNPALPLSTAAETDEASQHAVMVNPSEFPEPPQENEILESPVSTSPLSLDEPFNLEPAQKQISNNSTREAAAYVAYGDYESAQTIVEAAIAQDPRNDEHKVMLLAIYTARGQHDKANALSRQLLNQHPPVSEEIRKRIESIRSSTASAQRLGV